MPFYPTLLPDRAETETREGTDMQDAIFVALSIVFFVVGIGYVAACDRLMK
jgi:hypothetical protein